MKTPLRMKRYKILCNTWIRKEAGENYCTECGDELEDFCFSSTSDNLELVLSMYAQCKRKEKFTGGMCAKLFIASPKTSEELPDERKESEDL